MSLRLPARHDVRLLATAVALPTDLAPAGQRGRVMDEAAVLAHIAPAAARPPHGTPLDAEVVTRQWVQDADAIDLAVEAGRQALARAGLQAHELSAILCASSTPVSISAAMASRVSARLLGESVEEPGIFNPCAYDIRGGGIGALQAWITAQGLIAQGAGPVLVLAAETPSKFLQPGDVGTALRYGDGAGACILGPSTEARPSFLGGLSGQRPLAGRPTTIPGPLPPAGDLEAYRFQKPDCEHLADLGRLWSQAPRALAEAFPQALAATRFVLPYGVSHRQMATAVEALGAPQAECFHELARLGCVGAASPLVALHGLLASGRAAAGDVLCLLSAAGNGVWMGFYWQLDEHACQQAKARTAPVP
jgi:3-oxoacyl-[acyl-carrier-protein] synthase-3